MNSLAATLRSVYRSTLLLTLLLAATVDLCIRRPRKGAEGAIWIHGWCKRIVAAMRIECVAIGTSAASGAVVSNHLSYLDILLYSSIRPFIMVSKSEVKGWPLLGRLTAQAGTVYVDRDGGPATYPAVNLAMAEAYRSGLPVLFFPEGTTTDGAGVLPFRRGLFHSVLNNGVELRTASLRYSSCDQNATANLADHVCWWGDALLAPHLFRCLGLQNLSAQIAFGEIVAERDDRFVLSETAQARVAQSYEDQKTRVIPHEARDLPPSWHQVPQQLRPSPQSAEPARSAAP